MKRLILTIIFVLLVWAPFLSAALAGNESCNAFTSGCDTGNGANTNRVNSVSLGHLIAEGGGYFLQSIADIHLLFSRVELSEVSGTDFQTFQVTINTDIDNMEKAQVAYWQLKTFAASIPYNQAVISQLIEFDYPGFQLETGLIPSIFAKVQDYLARGDVRGIYNEFYNNTGQILEMLRTLKKDMDAGISPNLAMLWRLNQRCSEYKLFGQYVAEVFYRIK